MAASDLASRLHDILDAVGAVSDYTAGKTLDDYTAERMLRDAVERNIERISEASRHIPAPLTAGRPDIPWRKIAGIGNILRHACPIVDDRLIWEAVTRDLPPLKAAVEVMLREVEAGEDAGSGAGGETKP